MGALHSLPTRGQLMLAVHLAPLEKSWTSFHCQLLATFILLLVFSINGRKLWNATHDCSTPFWWYSAKALTIAWAEHSWGRCVHVRFRLNNFKQHNTLVQACAVNHTTRPQPLWKESLIDFFLSLVRSERFIFHRHRYGVRQLRAPSARFHRRYELSIRPLRQRGD